ncbi:MAG: FAD-dependent monooxygenase [Opitutales bacterium]|nr:FAD-dependent monooxygenase [Opitutales bacterium]
MKKIETEVLVAGAGPVGMCAALFLDAKGIGVTVVDSAPGVGTHSYGLALHADTLERLESLGLRRKVEARGVPVRAIRFHDRSEEVQSLPLGEDGTGACLSIGQAELEEILAAALRARGVPLLWQHALTDFRDEGQSVQGRVDELEQRLIGYASAHMDWFAGRTKPFTARLLVGADGHRSVTRRRLKIPFEEVGTPETFAVFEFKSDAPPDEVLHIVMERGHVSAHWPLPHNVCRWSFEVDDCSALRSAREKDRDLAQWVGGLAYPALREEVLGHFLDDRVPWFAGERGNLYWRSLVRFENRLVPRFGAGRVWLAGDAAHLTGPVGIQSMNQGIAEAGRIAAAVKEMFDDGHTEPVPLIEYGNESLRQWRFLHGIDGPAAAAEGTGEYFKAHAARLRRCLPATGTGLRALGERVGIDF